MDDYGVLSGYEDGHDKDDEKGSRGIPSRTSLGSEAAFIKEFPCYGGTRRFFFGLIEVRNWEYRCVLTLPQIELMQSDLPHTLYNHKDKNGNPSVSKADYDEAQRANQESLKRSIERRKRRQQEQGYTVSELFNGEAD